MIAQESEKSLESVPLTLFQLTARADLIARIRVRDGTLRLAVLDVLDGLKGEAPGDRIRLDFRDLNLSPQGQGMVTFRNGEEYVLFMSQKVWRKPKEKNRDIFDLTHGRHGMMPLPPEGWGIDVEAVKQLVSLTQRGPEEQILGLREALAIENPILREAVLDELSRLRAVEPQDLPLLTRLLIDPSPRIQTRSLRLIAIHFQSLLATGGVDDDERNTLASVLERSRNDGNETVRSEAVRTLGAWPNQGELTGDLRAIAKQDASQSVRYEAERILFRSKAH